MRRRLIPPIAALVALVAATAALAAGSTANIAAYTALNPGGVTPLNETVDVNVVFVGMSPNTSVVDDTLPATASPKTRYKLFYGLDSQAELGINYTYNYSFFDTSLAWENSLFAYLTSIKQAKPRTLYQDLYNEQAGSRDVGQNHWIDAPSVEKWLIANPPAGVDPTKPTMFFLNWFGRGDFVDHVYTKIGEPDPDTGNDFGLVRQSRKIVAWGGTAPDDEETGYAGVPRRVWFYDMSAGPETWGGSYEITSPDIDGDGVRDYRLPPIWEYSGSPLAYVHPGYAGARSLDGDLAKVIRTVGLDLLFTSSPLYPPYFTANKLPSSVNLDVNTVEGWNQVDGSDAFITPDLFLAEEKELPTGFNSTLTQDYQDIKFDGDWNRCFKQFVSDKVCYNDLHPAYATFGGFVNMFLVAGRNTTSFLNGTPGYEAGMINWSTGQKPKDPGLLGFADDNWLDATQSGVFSFVYPQAVAAGYGLTTTMIHEYGHHSSMSHPHDGYDPVSGVDFEPTGDFFFAWLGDESNSMMSYIDVNWDFSQFDRDNSARHHAAGYAKIANVVAVLLAGKASAAPFLAAADGHLVAAQVALAAHDYAGTLSNAKLAYDDVMAGAAAAPATAVSILQPSTWTIVGPIKPGNGPNGKANKKGNGAKDLETKANVKRMFAP
jgi:hypothetical protein